MKLIKTINLKVNDLPKQDYLTLIQNCNGLFNDYTNHAYEVGSYSKNKCHQTTYRKFQEKYPTIKSALLQGIRDQAMSACKRNKLKGKIPIKKSLSLNLNIRSFDLRGKQLTLIGLNKRHKEILHVPDYYQEIYQTWKVGSATLSYDKKKKQFWIHLTYSKEVNDPIKPKLNTQSVLGVDRGINNVIATSDGLLVSSERTVFIKNKYDFLRKKLQKKGTRSSKRLLRKRNKKEKRFVLDTNHCISKKLVNSNYNIFVLEDLKGIKEKNTNKYQNKWKNKKPNSKLNNWSYFQLQQFLEYKADAKGKLVVYVKAAYTSQTCSKCGHCEEKNRIEDKFVCLKCGHAEHADLNAAKNIKDRYIKQFVVPVNEPYVSEPLKASVTSHLL